MSHFPRLGWDLTRSGIVGFLFWLGFCCFRWKGDGSMEIKLETASTCMVSHERQCRHTSFLQLLTKHSPVLLWEYGSSVAVHIKSHKDIQALLDSASFSWVTVPAGPYTGWPCTCSGEGSQPGGAVATQHFHRSVGGYRARGKRGGYGAAWKAYQPWLRKGMLGLHAEGVTHGSRNICRGTHHGSVHCCVAGTYQRRQRRWTCTLWSSTQKWVWF